jgi:hypothetical protein
MHLIRMVGMEDDKVVECSNRGFWFEDFTSSLSFLGSVFVVGYERNGECDM